MCSFLHLYSKKNRSAHRLRGTIPELFTCEVRDLSGSVCSGHVALERLVIPLARRPTGRHEFLGEGEPVDDDGAKTNGVTNAHPTTQWAKDYEEVIVSLDERHVAMYRSTDTHHVSVRFHFTHCVHHLEDFVLRHRRIDGLIEFGVR